jgi:deoxycytidine triphosphate deaminase
MNSDTWCSATTPTSISISHPTSAPATLRDMSGSTSALRTPSPQTSSCRQPPSVKTGRPGPLPEPPLAGPSSRYAASEDEARERFEAWRHTDPFPGIEPALLNSADIADYVAATGLIYPFEEERLKPASYPLALGGKIVWWDNTTRARRVLDLKPGNQFELQPNSIAFVSLEPLIQLTDYVALRFNLRIQYIYRGLLLGTGPLVDPGFVGQLSFPLHNLTTNSYHFVGGEEVVWVEFTKISRNQAFNDATSKAPGRAGTYKRYPAVPGRNDVEDYVREALGGDPSRHVWSSISEALNDAKGAVKTARIWNVAVIIGVAALAASVIALAANLWWNELNGPSKSEVTQNEREIVQLRTEVGQLKAQLRSSGLLPATSSKKEP